VFLRVLADAPEKPLELLSLIDALTNQPGRENIDRFAHIVREFRGWEISHATWPARFMQDSELNWLHHPPPIDDIQRPRGIENLDGSPSPAARWPRAIPSRKLPNLV
jgi:hypothetical protein